MCVLYVSFGSRVKPWVVQVIFGLSVRLLCIVQANTLCRYGCMYLFASLVCVDVIVMSPAWAMTWTGALGSGK